jgi:hypothetical protein
MVLSPALNVCIVIEPGDTALAAAEKDSLAATSPLKVMAITLVALTAM